MPASFLPTSLAEGELYYHDFSGFDVVFITGDPYYDHPLSGVALLSRLVDAKGYRVGIVAQPQTDEEFQACGRPRLLFCITTGLLDSMLANYTPMLRRREGVLVPERGLHVYTQRLKHLFPGCVTVLGGVEATIRRFTHFDYKDNGLRRSILDDTKADLLLFGNAERSLLLLLERMRCAKESLPDQENDAKNVRRSDFDLVRDLLDLPSLDGAAFRLRKGEGAAGLRALPSHEECVADPDAFMRLTAISYAFPDDGFVQACGAGRLRHNRPSHPLDEEELDRVYALPFTRELHPHSKNLAFNEEMVGFLKTSVVIGRGCWGSCAFCVIPLVQGKHMAKRSARSILKEIENLYTRGESCIADLTLPTLNMYGSHCALYDQPESIRSPILDKGIIVFNKAIACNQRCVGCVHRKLSDELIPVLVGVERLMRRFEGTSLELRSALRHDIVLRQKELLRKAMRFTTRLKIAPEHCAPHVLAAMRKGDTEAFEAFLKEFNSVNREQGTHKRLVPYFVAAHPGCTLEDMRKLKAYCDERNLFVELTQAFTPTPGTLSTAMYYTGKDPLTREPIHVPRTFREKKDQKNALVDARMRAAHREDDEEFADENG